MKIKINNAVYEIKFVNPNDNNLRENSALFNGNTKEIFIDNAVKNKEELLIHELTHAIIYEYMINVIWDEENVALFIGKYFNKIKSILESVIY